MIERSRHNPYEIGLAIALLALSFYGILFTPASTSLDRGMSEGMRLAYGVIGILGAAGTLIGIRIKDEHLGLVVEAFGQLFMCGGATTFVVTLCAVSTFSSSGLVTVTAASIAASAACRVVQILRDVRRWSALISAAAKVQAVMEPEGRNDEA